MPVTRPSGTDDSAAIPSPATLRWSILRRYFLSSSHTQTDHMASSQSDPLVDLVTDRRIYTRPPRYYGTPTVLTIDLNLLAATLTQRIDMVYQNDERIYMRIGGTCAEATQTITNLVTSMVDFAIGITYNRLRSILNAKDNRVGVLRMNPRCPIPNNMVFPTWLSNTLSSIGPCRIVDGPTDNLIVYASTTATMNYYGRKHATIFDSGPYYHLISILRELNIGLSPINFTNKEGSYFPTIQAELIEGTWTLYGTIHPSHYENEDVARIALCTSETGVLPFENIMMTIGYVDNEATINALANIPALAGLPAGQSIGSPGRPCHARFRVNYFGIQPAVSAAGDVPAQAHGIYILGRGLTPYYHCVLAQNICAPEVIAILRYRLMLPEKQSQAKPEISRKVFGGFNLITWRFQNTFAEDMAVSVGTKTLDVKRDVYVRYSFPITGFNGITLIQRMEDSVDLNDFKVANKFDIDTTGLVCCWPSEEILTYFCLNHLDMFRSKRILELGSGYGLAGLAIAATSVACEVVISDGNPEVVNYIQRNIDLNAYSFGDTKVKSLKLHWSSEGPSDMLSYFDIIVASDCTFFKEYHDSLARTVKSLLKCSATSMAVFFSPRRGDSLDIFLEKIMETGLKFELIEIYDIDVWKLHRKFLPGHDASWPNYDQDHCYPMLLKIAL